MNATLDTQGPHLVDSFQPRPHLHVCLDDEGHPLVFVPCDWMWDIVEYLSYHRLNLRYHFDGTSFRIVFLCQSTHKAQQLLDDWAMAADEQTP